ncbi:hypothetical protein [uncultured Pseudodesulfovibrio sp.]|uniref:hypothetical protein n=1 Tax=uncultured Pseudodesulfovibrio sp. TaxID=2035858 RepID=UPI0029C64B09|nr:hypothetical protein [uncultured Pseudodesulfovibrio sp.]
MLNKMVTAQIITKIPNKNDYDKSLLLDKTTFPAIHNTTILHALLSQTKKIKEVFEQPKMRKVHAASAKILISQPFFEQLGIKDEAEDFIVMLESDTSLKTNKLPNPFTTLPQVAFGGTHSTLVEVGLQCSTFSPEYKMLRAYLEKDMDTAYTIACSNSFNDKKATNLKELIISKKEAATRLEEFINNII